MKFILRTLAIFVAVAVATWLVPGVGVVGSSETWPTLIIMAFIITLLNMTIKPLLQILGLPITIISLGVFYLIINTLLLYIAAAIADALFAVGFAISSFASGFIASIIISLVSTIMNAILGTKD